MCLRDWLAKVLIGWRMEGCGWARLDGMVGEIAWRPANATGWGTWLVLRVELVGVRSDVEAAVRLRLRLRLW